MTARTSRRREHDAGAESSDEFIGRLHQLPAWREIRTGDMSRRIVLRIAHVEHIERALVRLGAPALEHSAVDALDAEALGDTPGGRLGGREALGGRRARALVLAAVAGEPGEAPAHGAVAQRHHLVGYAGIDQRTAPR